MGIELTYSLPGPEEQQFAERIEELVQICINLKPKALSVLKDATDGVIRASQWKESRSWFEHPGRRTRQCAPPRAVARPWAPAQRFPLGNAAWIAITVVSDMGGRNGSYPVAVPALKK
jgi:hypothetical protein